MNHLLIDGDVVAYKAACSVERACEWEPGHWTWHCDFNEVQSAVENELARVTDLLDGDKVTIALTDGVNFRKAILPTYKGNRANVKKPLVLKAIRQWLIDEKGAKCKPGLEGDDILGILSTRKPMLKDERRIIVSIDKDMHTIPGWFYRNAEVGLQEVDEAAADYFHLLQTLTGDTTDGYSGCPGIGAKKAANALDEDPSWATVVALYEKAGLDEHAALTQARVARILRASDFNFKTQEPILWTPPTSP